MKTITKTLLTVLLGVGLLQAAAFEKIAKSRATHVEVSSEKPLTTGNNTLKLVVLHENFKDSKVSVKVFMPAMPGMPYMESVSDAVAKGNGVHEANVNLSMSGTWQMHIFITTPSGKKIRAKTSLNI